MAATGLVHSARRPEKEGEFTATTCRKATLGNVRLRHQESNSIILIPTPSADPNDPLNWCVNF